MMIFIIGLPGVGKTTFAQQLASHLHMDWFDLDQIIVDQQQKPITSLFKESGEEAFRKMESVALQTVIDNNRNAVIATGGGTPCFGDNMNRMLANGTCILLKAEIGIVTEHIVADAQVRPMFLELDRREIAKKLSYLWDKRKSYYQQTHIITGLEAIQKPQLLTNRVELFTKKGVSLNDIIEID